MSENYYEFFKKMQKKEHKYIVKMISNTKFSDLPIEKLKEILEIINR